MIYRAILAGILATTASMPASAWADELSENSAPEAENYYSGLEDLPLRRDITNLGQNYSDPLGQVPFSASDYDADSPYLESRDESAGGYVSFGSPATSTFLGGVPIEKDNSFMGRVEFGVDWRPDVGGVSDQERRRPGSAFSAGEIDRVGVRADLTALLRDKAENDNGSTAWRVTGMLGSTSLSLLSDEDETSPNTAGGGLLWDIGIGWSSGAMSLNAGYQSVFSLNESDIDGSGAGMLSLGADYSILPGLSVYGEFNMTDDPLNASETGLGTVVIVGTGVNF